MVHGTSVVSVDIHNKERRRAMNETLTIVQKAKKYGVTNLDTSFEIGHYFEKSLWVWYQDGTTEWEPRLRESLSIIPFEATIIPAPTLVEIPLPFGWHVWQEEASGLWHIYDNYYTDPFDETEYSIGHKDEQEARIHAWIMAKNLGLFKKKQENE